MHITSFDYRTPYTLIPAQANLAGQAGVGPAPRRSAVLSRRELQRLIIDMVD